MKKTEIKPIKEKRKGFDIPFFVIVMLLLAFGLIMVLSSSYASAYYRYGDSFLFASKQLKYALVGLLGMGFCIVADYKRLKPLAWPIIIFSFILLILVAIPGVGTKLSGARRWLFGFQPSEYTKLAIIIFFAAMISTHQKYMNNFKTGVLPYMLVLVATAGLLFLQPHMSATVLICAVGMIMVLVGGAPIFPFGLLAIGGVGGLATMIAVLPHARERMANWLHPELDALDSGYQILQSLYAIGSGGLMGLGLGQSRQKYLYIPEPHNDFIFAIVCEELGLIGALLVLALFVLLIWRGFSIAFRAPDKFATLLVVGIISLIAIQFILNIAVVTNTIPTTGIPLPFFSYGGTALIMILVEMGIVLNVSRYCKK